MLKIFYGEGKIMKKKLLCENKDDDDLISYKIF